MKKIALFLLLSCIFCFAVTSVFGQTQAKGADYLDINVDSLGSLRFALSRAYESNSEYYNPYGGFSESEKKPVDAGLFRRVMIRGKLGYDDMVTLTTFVCDSRMTWFFENYSHFLDSINGYPFKRGYSNVKLKCPIESLDLSAATFDDRYLPSHLKSGGVNSILPIFLADMRLKEYVLPEVLTVADEGCLGVDADSPLERVTLPSGLQAIDIWYPLFLTNLKYIRCLSPAPPQAWERGGILDDATEQQYIDWLNANSKSDKPSPCGADSALVIVPDGSVAAYRSAPGWRLFKRIVGESEATAVKDTPAADKAKNSEHVFTLDGLPAQEGTRGIVIERGRKRIVR